jgi:hypothetical protein
VSNLHVYGVAPQPAHRWFIDIGWPESKRIWFRWSKFKRIRCLRCNRVRLACNLVVHAYYDQTPFFCKEACKRRSRRHA